MVGGEISKESSQSPAAHPQTVLPSPAAPCCTSPGRKRSAPAAKAALQSSHLLPYQHLLLARHIHLLLLEQIAKVCALQRT